jgi:ABC-type lipoprotein release transport system permease subunit
MIIPVTFLKITQTLREIEKGETVEIVGSDPETRKDLFKILKAERDPRGMKAKKWTPYEGVPVSSGKTEPLSHKIPGF